MANLSVTAANVVPSSGATFLDALAYEAITQGQPVALLTPPIAGAAIPTVRLADATAQYQVIGIAATGGSPGQPIKVIISDPALAMGATVAGDVLYLGPAGGITILYADLTAGKYVAVLGVGTGTGKVNMRVTRADTPK